MEDGGGVMNKPASWIWWVKGSFIKIENAASYCPLSFPYLHSNFTRYVYTLYFHSLTNAFISSPHLLLRPLSLHQSNSYWDLIERFILLTTSSFVKCFLPYFPCHHALLIFFLCPLLLPWCFLCSHLLQKLAVKCWRSSSLDPKRFYWCPVFLASV